MIKSMTGFGQAKGTFGNKEINVGIKALNGKMTDVRVKLPNIYKEKEIEIRKMVLTASHRGKLDVAITFNGGHCEEDHALNADLFTKYYQELSTLQSNLNIPNGDLIQTIIRIPNVIGVKEEKIEEEEWNMVQETIHAALGHLDAFRSHEGDSLYKDLQDCIHRIQKLLTDVSEHEEARKEQFTNKIKRNLEEFMQRENVDKNRFEQELLFYLEKLDINEEKVRLGQHCDYFLSEMDTDKVAKGKKLGFIAQEIGREINTMGAKAQYAPLQKVVVQMKEELEKIREQALNIL